MSSQTWGHKSVLQWGASAFVSFHGLGEKGRMSLCAEYGSFFLSGTAQARPSLVEVVFAPVSVPRPAVAVGGSMQWHGDRCFISEGDRWCTFSPGQLFSAEHPLQITCDHGYDLVRLMGKTVEPALRIRSLAQQILYVHSAAALTPGGAGLLMPAWGNTGKTNLLLELLSNGWELLGDDWCAITHGRMLQGFPRAVNLLSYNLRRFPHLRKRAPLASRIAFAVEWTTMRLREAAKRQGGLLMRASEMGSILLEKASNTHVPLERFPFVRCGSANLNCIAELVKVPRGSPLTIREADSDLFIRRLTECFMYENRAFLERLAECRFASGRESIPTDDGVRRRYTDLALEMAGTGDGTRTLLCELPENADRHCLDQVRQTLEQILAPAS